MLNLTSKKLCFNLSYNIIAEKWYKTEKGRNCPSNDVIRDGLMCRSASETLGLKCSTCEDSITRSTIRPAGCYFYGDFDTNFNLVVQTSETNPESHTGGICVRSGMLII